MKDYRFLIEETIRNMDSKISSYWLMEGIAEIAKQFPKVPEEKLRELIALDPTYKGGEQLGKYGQWIIRLFYNNIKNIERMKQYKEFLKQNPDGINPKTGQPIAKPELLPDVSRAEDYEKIPNLLKQYDLYKNKIKKPITDFKTIPELYQAIEEFTKQDVPADKRALERYYVFKDCEKKGLKKIYEDNKWMIGIPTTLESSVPFGNFTNWCTTSAHGQYYRHYLERYGGQYFILLNKQNGDLYQFHFESEQFMDEKDHKIDMYNFTKDNRKIAEFLNEYKQKLLNKIATGDEDRENDDKEYIKLKELLERFNGIASDPQQVTRNILYDNYTKDVSISGDRITGQFDLSSLGNIVYSSSDFSLETACGLLTDFFFHFDMGDMGDIDDNDEAYRWNPIARESNIPDFDWDRLCRIYKDEEFDDEEDEED